MSRTFHHSVRWGKLNRWNRAHGHGYGQSPSWWVREFMNQPQRHRSRMLLHKIKHGYVDADTAAFPLGSRKPHIYFW